MNRIFALLTFFALVLTSALAVYRGRILIDEDNYLSLAHFGTVGNAPAFVCGGVLITFKHVLTAAHCGVSKKKNVVYLGSRKWWDAPIVAGIRKVETSPNYNSKWLFNDLAIITLEHGAMQKVYDAGLRPMKINWDASNLPLDTKLRFMGFGKNSKAPDAQPVERARIGSSYLCENNVCREKYRIRTKRYMSICLDGRHSSACPGDSGGPLFYAPCKRRDPELVGIISGGEAGSSCIEGETWHAVNVEAHKEWIEAITTLHAKWNPNRKNMGRTK